MRVAIAVLYLCIATAADACTTFCTRGLFGRNYDFDTGHGMVVVNKRGMAKTSARAKPAKWTAKHGSLTFNQFGRDNPTGGINEKGLVVELMWMDGTRYPDADARPELGTLEWIQYQLDTSASVAEAVANAGKIRISQRGVPLHYLIADPSGDVAAIEFLDGKLVVHRGSSLPVPVLANDPYRSSLERDGDRFARAAKGLAGATTVDAAFRLLHDVRQSHTQWSIVYDLRNLAVHWRTAPNADIRNVRLAAFDFSCATPARVLAIDEGTGDVTKRFRDYTTAANLDLVRRSYRDTPFLRQAKEEEIVDAAKWPDRASCR
jgi:penicillin V acylase-like amidase (Ntn superfamily)